MKTIVVAAHKGGVGKTTISLSLGMAGVAAGKRVLVIDLDSVQGSLRFVWNARGQDGVAMLPVDATPGQLKQVLDQAREHFDYVIVDTPPSVSSWLPDVLALSDFAYVVTGTVDAELDSVAKTFAVVRKSGVPRAFVVNKALKDDKDSDAEIEKLREFGEIATIIYDRRVHRGVMKNGQTAIDRHYPHARAEIEALLAYTKDKVGE